MELKGYQRKYLSSLAQKLDPAVMVGKQGGSAQVEAALDEALSRLELVKIRFVAEKDHCEEICRDLEKRTSSTLVRVIGNTGVFYREAEDPDKRIIRIPEKK